MYEYSHGGNAVFETGDESVIDLSASVNPLGMPEGVMDAIIREIPNCERYPDSLSHKLREKIAEYEKVDADLVFCGNGASDIIFRLPGAVCAKRVMVTAPTFSDYERSALSFGSETIRYTLSSSNEFDIDSGFIDAVRRAKPDLVFVCNPNNPTGRLTEKRLIAELLDCCRELGAVVVVDECFLDFTEKADEYECKAFLTNFSRLVILKAFTKLFALPGLRLGYAICADKRLVESLYRSGADWSVSNLAQAAGIAAIDGAESFIERSRKYVSDERKIMEKALTQLGYRVFQSEANYVFLRNPYPFDLRDELDKVGIRIRSCINFHGLGGDYFRIAVSTKENNIMFLEAIEELNRK